MKRKRRFPQRDKNEKRINEQITAPRLTVISSGWEHLGEMSRNDAMRMAEDAKLDLVQMGIKQWVPLVKIMDYGKYLYEQKKQQAGRKQNAKKTEVKTMKITYKIGDHDLQVRKKQAEKWAKDWNPMRIFLQLRGRENHYEDIAVEKIKEFVAMMEDSYKQDERSKIQKQWNTFNILLHPKK